MVYLDLETDSGPACTLRIAHDVGGDIGLSLRMEGPKILRRLTRAEAIEVASALMAAVLDAEPGGHAQRTVVRMWSAGVEALRAQT